MSVEHGPNTSRNPEIGDTQPRLSNGSKSRSKHLVTAALAAGAIMFQERPTPQDLSDFDAQIGRGGRVEQDIDTGVITEVSVDGTRHVVAEPAGETQPQPEAPTAPTIELK